MASRSAARSSVVIIRDETDAALLFASELKSAAPAIKERSEKRNTLDSIEFTSKWNLVKMRILCASGSAFNNDSVIGDRYAVNGISNFKSARLSDLKSETF